MERRVMMELAERLNRLCCPIAATLVDLDK